MMLYDVMKACVHERFLFSAFPLQTTDKIIKLYSIIIFNLNLGSYPTLSK